MTNETQNGSIDTLKLAEIKEEYIYGTINDEGKTLFLSYSKLADKYKVHESAIKRAAAPERWPKLRKDYRTKTELKVVEKKSEVSAENIVRSDDKFENAGELIRRVGVKKLEQIESEIDDKKFVRSIDIMNAANSVRIGQEIVKTAQGEMLGKIGVEQSGRYEVTKKLIGTNEHINHELGVLNAISKKQDQNK